MEVKYIVVFYKHQMDMEQLDVGPNEVKWQSFPRQQQMSVLRTHRLTIDGKMFIQGKAVNYTLKIVTKSESMHVGKYIEMGANRNVLHWE